MSEFQDVTRDISTRIREILCDTWDPIGVGNLPEAHDEYDAYCHQLHGMLIRREARHKFVDYLWWAETQHMALPGNRDRIEETVDRLLNLWENDAPPRPVRNGTRRPPAMAHHPCPICGECDYTPGTLNPHAPVVFKVEANSLWEVLFTRGLPITARVCNGCGNIQMFVENMRDLLKKQRSAPQDGTG